MNFIKDIFQASIIARLVAIIFIGFSFTKQPIGYYTFLRWIVSGTALYTLFLDYINKNQITGWIWILGIITLLFNPLFPFYIGKDAWQVVDIITGIIFLISIFFVNEINLVDN